MNIEQIIFSFNGIEVPVTKYSLQFRRKIDDQGRPVSSLNPHPVELIFSEYPSELLDFLDSYKKDFFNCNIRYLDQNGNKLGKLDLEKVRIVDYEEVWEDDRIFKCGLRVLLMPFRRIRMLRERGFDLNQDPYIRIME